MSENVFKTLLNLIPILGAVVTYFLIPCIKANTDSAKLSQYREWAGLAVKTAEMIWTETGHGADKKEYVTSFLTGMLNSKKTVVTEEQINILIEAAVRQLKEIKEQGE